MEKISWRQKSQLLCLKKGIKIRSSFIDLQTLIAATHHRAISGGRGGDKQSGYHRGKDSGVLKGSLFGVKNP